MRAYHGLADRLRVLYVGIYALGCQMQPYFREIFDGEQQQGAKAVLATLWPVADQSTAMLMADLYRRRQSNSLTKIEAIRQSQIALQSQSKYVHPYYWAPLILMGNWK